ncbi:hypothetical protein DVH24_004678 [Malus domestica]|uniref:Uncharacterized protein n=1 Tax=Malus domestica TaxID=3750 RepID=A0A498IF14_MALDO|nr:hypothetical protein DVH24_004678 [Malus domestica]
MAKLWAQLLARLSRLGMTPIGIVFLGSQHSRAEGELATKGDKRVENRLEELCINSSVLVPLFIVIRRRETCFPSNTKHIRKDLLDSK